MSSPPRPITSAPPRRAVPVPPTRPIKPYISLDDVNAQEFFTKPHVFNHLRRAGLLNRNGQILTQAEYDSKQKDIVIGRENQRKVDDALVDVLCDLAREHWAYTRDYTEQMRIDLLHQFRRMENECSRRTQPITIRHRSDGRIQIETEETTVSAHADETQDRNRSSTGILPRVIQFQPNTRPRSAQPSGDLDDVRKELDKMKNKLIVMETKLNKDSKANETRSSLSRIEQTLSSIQKQQTNVQEQQKLLAEKVDKEKLRVDRLVSQSVMNRTKPSAPDNPTPEDSSQLSSLVQQLQDRILNLETSLLHLSRGLSQDVIDQELDTNNDSGLDRGHAIANVARTTGNKLKTMQTELTQLASKVNQSTDSITFADAHQLVQNETQTLLQNHKKDLEGDMTERINDLENQWNIFLQENPNGTPSNPSQPIDRALLIQKPLQPTNNNNLQQVLNDVEKRLNNVPSQQHLSQIEQRIVQLENQLRSMNDSRVSALQDQIKTTTAQVQTLQRQVDELDKKKLTRQEIEQRLDNMDQRIKQVDQSIQNNEKINQRINALEQFLQENRETLKKMEKKLNQQQS